MLERMKMGRKYAHFSDLVAVASARELGYLILNAEYTQSFTVKLRNIIKELEDGERTLASISVLFNTNGEIAVIDETLIGRFIAFRYKSVMEGYYKDIPLNRIVKAVMGGGEKKVLDFLGLSFDVLYDSLEELYKETKCRKDVLNNFKKRYNIQSYNKEDGPIVTAVMMILEDIISYIGINESYIFTISALKVRKSFSHFI